MEPFDVIIIGAEPAGLKGAEGQKCVILAGDSGSGLMSMMCK